MATQRQRKAVEKIVENRGNVSKSMREAGYLDTTAKNPKNLTESKGYLETLDELGLTDKLLVTSLVDDIKKKPQNRKAEIELGSKMRGMLVERKDITSGGDKLTIALVEYVGDDADTDN